VPALKAVEIAGTVFMNSFNRSFERTAGWLLYLTGSF